MNEPTHGIGITILRWIARIGSIIIIAGVLAIFIGEGGFNPFKLTAQEASMMVCFWGSCIGLGLAWKWEGIGGTISVSFMAIFFALEFAFSGHFPRGWAFEVIAFPGILFLTISLLGHFRKSNITPAN